MCKPGRWGGDAGWLGGCTGLLPSSFWKTRSCTAGAEQGDDAGGWDGISRYRRPLNASPGQRACRCGVLAPLGEDAQGNLPGARSAPSLVHPGAGSRTRPPCPPCQACPPPGCWSHSDPVQASGILGRDIPPPRPCTLSDTKLVFSL